MPNDSLKPRRRRFLKLGAVLLAVAIAWVIYDLYAPRAAHLKEFDADEVARLETAMWRSYYEKRRLQLFNQLSELLRTQYNMPLIRSNRVAYNAAKAAFVFQRGKERSDYEKALPDLIAFYSAIREMSDLPFDVSRTARLELEWWIIHRERARHAPDDLARALAELQSAIYGVPVDQLMDHGRLRAEAMTIRDNKAEAGGVSEEDWVRIDTLLHASWQSLKRTVKA